MKRKYHARVFKRQFSVHKELRKKVGCQKCASLFDFSARVHGMLHEPALHKNVLGEIKFLLPFRPLVSLQRHGKFAFCNDGHAMLCSEA